jgi:hypothetical protein
MPQFTATDIPAGDLELHESLDCGGFGTVFKATTEGRSIIWSSPPYFNRIFTINNRAYFVFHQTFAISKGYWTIHCLHLMQYMKLLNIIPITGKDTTLGAEHPGFM